MSLITLLNAQIAFGERPLLDEAQLTVRAGERLGLIGRNGTGKSTLLGVLAGKIPLDDGELQRREGLRLGLVEQEPQLPAADTLQDSLLLRARACAAWSDGVPADEREHWRLESRLEEFLHRFGLTGDFHRRVARVASASALRSPWRSRYSPTCCCSMSPPIISISKRIERLEELLLKVPAAIVITHDRAFLDRVTTRIIELDRGVLRSYPGSFAAYEQRKDEELAAEDTARRRFEKFWQQEEVWIRKGVEARRTRNEGRVRRLEQLRIERATRRDRLGNIRLTLDAGERSGDLVAEFDSVSKRFAATTAYRATLDADHARRSHRPHRPERRGQVDPDPSHSRRTRARRRHGAPRNPPEHRLLRSAASPARPDRDPRRGHQSRLGLGAARQRAQAHRELSRGVPVPRAARASRRSACSPAASATVSCSRACSRNLQTSSYWTSRPTISTSNPWSCSKQRLQDYKGTLLLVSHDRRFLDNVVTQTLAAEGNGVWREYAGGYSDYLQQRPPVPVGRANEAGQSPARHASRATALRGATPVKARTRLSYKEERELAALPGEIESLEREQTELTARMSAPDYHRLGGERLRGDRKRLAELEELLLEKFARWESLEEQRARPA